jgi:hypothetical protein
MQAEDRLNAGRSWIAQKVGVSDAGDVWSKLVSPVTAANRWITGGRTYKSASSALRRGGAAFDAARTWIREASATNTLRWVFSFMSTASGTPESATPASSPPSENKDAGAR